MIKLIASDLDGTLLYGRGNSVSEEMFEMIREMKRKGIIFAAASGRQYHNLKKLFAPVWKDMAFICENGAAVFYEDQLIAEQVVPKEELLELVYMIDADERTEVALSSPTTTYVRPKTQEYVQSLIDLGNHVTILKEWADVTEPCVKVAWFEKGGVEHRVDYWNSKVKPPAKVVTSGAEWLDILYPNGHKGVGIQVLQEHFGLKKEEMAAFGDNYNDTEMLEAVGYPFGMNSGREGIVKMCPYHTDRVEDTVRQILDGKFPENK
jgi:Cof subfamily protein (haloacid dehalogenase superfamily)